MSEAENRVEEGREAVKRCLKCQGQYQKRNPYDITLLGLRAQCWSSSNGYANRANDPKEHRGRVGYQPW